MTRLSSLMFIAALVGACQFSADGVPIGESRPDARAGSDAEPARSDAAVDGTPAPDASADARAGVNKALLFDGNEDCVLVDRTIGQDFTLEAWIRTTRSTSGPGVYGGVGVIYANVAGPADDFSAVILNRNFAFGVGSDPHVESTTDVTTDQWIHVAAVREQSEPRVSVYVNGVQEDSRPGFNTRPLDEPPGISIGCNHSNGPEFEGLIDEVRVWDVVRTEQQIQAAMNTSLSGDEAGLVGYWRFDDDTAGVALDSSPTGNHGQLGGNGATPPSFVDSDAPVL